MLLTFHPWSNRTMRTCKRKLESSALMWSCLLWQRSDEHTQLKHFCQYFRMALQLFQYLGKWSLGLLFRQNLNLDTLRWGRLGSFPTYLQENCIWTRKENFDFHIHLDTIRLSEHQFGRQWIQLQQSHFAPTKQWWLYRWFPEMPPYFPDWWGSKKYKQINEQTIKFFRFFCALNATGRERKEDGKPCVTSATISLFEINFRQLLFSLDRSFW